MRRFVPLIALALAGCDAADCKPKATPPTTVAPLQAPAVAGSVHEVDLLAAAGARLTLGIAAGGGSVVPAQVTVGSDGRAKATWTLGKAPVAQRLAVTTESAEAATCGGAAKTTATEQGAVLATPATPSAAEPFGDVHAHLTARGIDGSTEDLAFGPDDAFWQGRLVLGVPGGLVAVDPAGKTSEIKLSGDPLVGPLGLAFDGGGSLWVADGKGHALRKVAPGGAVSTVATADGADALQQPNDVAVAKDGSIVLTDTCLGRVMRLDASGKVLARLDFDLAKDGSPNGVAFDAAGDLWLTTENTALLCSHKGFGLTDPIAGLYRLPLTATGFGARETVAAGLGLFGDGLAFDAEGNLYALFDTAKDFALDKTLLYVLAKGSPTPQVLLAAEGRVWANVAFGNKKYGTTTLYLALLAVPVFTPPEMRGVERFALGIAGP